MVTGSRPRIEISDLTSHETANQIELALCRRCCRLHPLIVVAVLPEIRYLMGIREHQKVGLVAPHSPPRSKKICGGASGGPAVLTLGPVGEIGPGPGWISATIRDSVGWTTDNASPSAFRPE